MSHDEERLAIMIIDGHLSESEARRKMAESMHVADNHYANKVARLRDIVTQQRMARNSRGVDRKKIAGGDI